MGHQLYQAEKGAKSAWEVKRDEYKERKDV
jgi:hypothetical protein